MNAKFKVIQYDATFELNISMLALYMMNGLVQNSRKYYL